MLKGIESPIVIVAACALINEDGALLIARRPAGRSLAGFGNFPAARSKPEEPEDACPRVERRAGHRCDETDLAPLTFASHAHPDFHLLMPVYLAGGSKGT
jgi:8-oxo-dGTP diphosphatase